MAKAENSAAPSKGRMKGLLILGAVGLFAGGIGFVVPYLLAHNGYNLMAGGGETETKQGNKQAQAFVPVGDIIVNLSEEPPEARQPGASKLILVVDASQEKPITELFAKNKAILKNWLISHLSDKTLAEVSGATGVNRLRREILEQFNAMLFPDGSEKIRDVLFEEFVVQ